MKKVFMLVSILSALAFTNSFCTENIEETHKKKFTQHWIELLFLIWFLQYKKLELMTRQIF
jgi:hypothetical protein